MGESGSELFVKAIYENTKRPPRCKICGATKILFIDGTFVYWLKAGTENEKKVAEEELLRLGKIADEMIKK